MTRAFAYLRVSGLAQVNGNGFDRQREAIMAYAAANEIEIVQWFEEKGVSGKDTWEDRPAWVDMIGQLNGVRTILVEKLDRLARDLFIQEYILRDLATRDVVLKTAAGEETGEEDATRVLFRQILGAIAQYDRTMIVHKLRAARNKVKATTGRCEGAKPYGETQREKLAIDTMKDLRLVGWSFDEIADELNRRGVATRHGKQWYGNTVNKILKAQEKN